MDKASTHTELAPDLSISPIVTGLWQIADMERDQRSLDLDRAAQGMKAYARAGLTTFDMADHYGSAEEIAGIFMREHAGDDDVQITALKQTADQYGVPMANVASRGRPESPIEPPLVSAKTPRTRFC